MKTSASSTVAPNAYNPKPLEKKSSTMNWFRDTAERFPLKNEYSGNDNLINQRLHQFLDGPGPAAYSSSTNLKASKSNTTNQPCRGWNLISAPALPVDKPGPLPGPGQYGKKFFSGLSLIPSLDVGVYKSPVKESMGSYMFKSNSSRLTKAKIANQPGPGAYTPKEFERFSYRHPASNHFVAA